MVISILKIQRLTHQIVSYNLVIKKVQILGQNCHLDCHPKNETPVNSSLRGFFVESGRLELPSKQAIQ